MAIEVSQPFNRQGGFPIDKAFVMTKAEMAQVNDSVMPEKYFTLCSENGKIYIYDKNNPQPTPDVGKFVEYNPSPTSGGDTFTPLADSQVDAILNELGIA